MTSMSPGYWKHPEFGGDPGLVSAHVVFASSVRLHRCRDAGSEDFRIVIHQLELELDHPLYASRSRSESDRRSP